MFPPYEVSEIWVEDFMNNLRTPNKNMGLAPSQLKLLFT